MNRDVSILDVLSLFGIRPNKQGKIKSIYKEEKTPSMHVYSGRGENHAYCYSTQKKASVIDIYMSLANEPDFKAALFALADRFNITPAATNGPRVTPRPKHPAPMPSNTPPPITAAETVQPSQEDYAEKIRGLNEYWQGIVYERSGLFMEQGEEQARADQRAYKVVTMQIKGRVYSALQSYCGVPTGAALEYLNRERCLTAETIERFKIFHIADYGGANEMLKTAFDPSELRTAGIISDKGNLKFFHHTIVIPYIRRGVIYDLKARYFYKGSHHPEKTGKYLFPTGSTAKKLFFSEDPEQLKGSEVWVFEGEFDSILAAQDGYKSIAIAGAGNIPENIISQVKGFNLILLGDRDESGEAAKDRLKELLTAAAVPFRSRKLTKDIPVTVKDYTDLYKFYHNKQG